MQSKLDRGYDDYLERRSSERAELSRLSQPTSSYAATGEKILELAKTAHSRYLEQVPREQRRLLDTVLSNCTFDRGTLCPTYAKPFDLLSQGVETGNSRREWDSNFHALNEICNFQIQQSQRCRACHRCRGALPAIARTLAVRY